MRETPKARRRRLMKRLGAEAQPKGPPPEKIYLPDQSQPLMRETEAKAIGKQRQHFIGGKMLGFMLAHRIR